MTRLFEDTSQALAMLQDARHMHYNCDMNDPFIAPALQDVRVALCKDLNHAARILAEMHSAQGNKAAFIEYRKRTESGSKYDYNLVVTDYLNRAFVNNQYAPQLYLQPADDCYMFPEGEFRSCISKISTVQKYFMTARTLDNLDHMVSVSRRFFEEINQFVTMYALPDGKKPKKQGDTRRKRKVYCYRR